MKPFISLPEMTLFFCLTYANMIGVHLQSKTALRDVDLEMKTWHQMYSGKYFKK